MVAAKRTTTRDNRQKAPKRNWTGPPEFAATFLDSGRSRSAVYVLGLCRKQFVTSCVQLLGSIWDFRICEDGNCSELSKQLFGMCPVGDDPVVPV